MEGVATRSGSLVSAPETRSVAVPRRARSPGFRPRRSSTKGSASNPKCPSRRASPCAIGCGGCVGLANERPGGVDGFQFDQGPLAGGRDQQRAHHGDVGDRGAALAQPLPQSVGQRDVAGVDRHVATENAAAIGGKAGIDGSAEATDGRNHANPQGKAEQDGGEASNAAAQVAASETERETDAPPG